MARLPSDTERATRDGDREDQRGRAALGGAAYCLVTGLGVGAFSGRPLTGVLAGAAVGLPVATWLMPAAAAERHDAWRDR